MEGDKLWTVVVETVMFDGKTKYFVDRVYRQKDGKRAYSNDSSWSCKEKAHERKAEIIRKELL